MHTLVIEMTDKSKQEIKVRSEVGDEDAVARARAMFTNYRGEKQKCCAVLMKGKKPDWEQIASFAVEDFPQ